MLPTNLFTTMRRSCLLYVLLTALLPSCTSGFEETNANPDALTRVTAAELITHAERNLVNLVLGAGFEGTGTYGLHYVQHLSQTRQTGVTRYDQAESSFYGFYTGGLQDLQTVIDGYEAGEEATVEVTAGQAAVARILKSWAFLSMTDFWGDLPYREALKGREEVAPAYDTQEDIYRGAVAALLAAGDALAGESITGDIIYAGDTERWRRFANSLVLRAGIRVADVQPALGKGWVNEALRRGVIESNADMASLIYTGDEHAMNTFSYDALYSYNYAVSSTLVDFLAGREDPRLPIYAQPTEGSQWFGPGAYVGMPYGITEEEAAAYRYDTISFPGEAFMSTTSPSILLSYSEVLFNRAEAAARGWTDADAAGLYRQAIRANMQQVGVLDDAAISAYLGREDVAFDKKEFRKSIGEQKWVAYYFQGMEAWSEWRRLGYPKLSPAPAPVLVSSIPTRRGYPQEEFAINHDNYLQALQRQFGSGEDPLTGRVWWDVK